MKALSERMLEYEAAEAGRRFLPLLAVCARLDGKCFHAFTRGLDRPYDSRFIVTMQNATKALVEGTVAAFGYTQSDEITLTWYRPHYGSQIFFDGRIQKIVSVLAGMATLALQNAMPDYLGGYETTTPPLFDCRAWQLPTPDEAANVFLWREQDATRNSVQMAAQSCYSHNELMNKDTKQMQEMLWQKDINWNNYPSAFKRGTFFQRRTVSRAFTTSELENLPPKHEARQNPDLCIERQEVRLLPMPPFGKVTNRVGVVFNGEDPIVSTEDADVSAVHN